MKKAISRLLAILGLASVASLASAAVKTISLSGGTDFTGANAIPTALAALTADGDILRFTEAGTYTMTSGTIALGTTGGAHTYTIENTSGGAIVVTRASTVITAAAFGATAPLNVTIDGGTSNGNAGFKFQALSNSNVIAITPTVTTTSATNGVTLILKNSTFEQNTAGSTGQTNAALACQAAAPSVAGVTVTATDCTFQNYDSSRAAMDFRTSTSGAIQSNIVVSLNHCNVLSGNSDTTYIAGTGAMNIGGGTATLDQTGWNISVTNGSVVSSNSITRGAVTIGRGSGDFLSNCTYLFSDSTIISTGTRAIECAMNKNATTGNFGGNSWTIRRCTIDNSKCTSTGTGAAATANFSGGVITSYTITNGGSGYTVAPIVTLSGGGFSTASTATAQISGGVVTNIIVTTAGAGYTSAPTVALAGAFAETVFMNYSNTSIGSGTMVQSALNLYNNVLLGCADNTATVGSGNATARAVSLSNGAVNVTAYHNTLIGGHVNGARFQYGDAGISVGNTATNGSTNALVAKDNLFYNYKVPISGTSATTTNEATASPVQLAATTNSANLIVGANDDTDAGASHVFVTSATPTLGTDEVRTDYKPKSTTLGDASNGAAVDAADSQIAGVPDGVVSTAIESKDRSNTNRGATGSWDIGAFEVNPVPVEISAFEIG